MGTAPKMFGGFKEIKSAVAEVNTYTSGDSSVLSRSVQAKKRAGVGHHSFYYRVGNDHNA